MNKIYIATCSFTVTSVILTSFSHKIEKPSMAATNTEGVLALVGNGEDLVRQGFKSKDGWQINFEHVFVNIAEATAYSTKAAFEPQPGEKKEDIEYKNKIDFINVEQTIDLATGDQNANPIEIAKVQVPFDFYNALTWRLSTANKDSAASGNTILLEGTANKDGQIINFKIGLNSPVEYICGEYVGDERLGIVAASSPGKVEATLHFDHIFGDSSLAPEDVLNEDSLGFQPLADLAQKNDLQLNDDALSRQLSSQDYQQLTQAFIGLGHVGEGHCVTNQL